MWRQIEVVEVSSTSTLARCAAACGFRSLISSFAAENFFGRSFACAGRAVLDINQPTDFENCAHICRPSPASSNYPPTPIRLQQTLSKRHLYRVTLTVPASEKKFKQVEHCDHKKVTTSGDSLWNYGYLGPQFAITCVPSWSLVHLKLLNSLYMPRTRRAGLQNQLPSQLLHILTANKCPGHKIQRYHAAHMSV